MDGRPMHAIVANRLHGDREAPLAAPLAATGDRSSRGSTVRRFALKTLRNMPTTEECFMPERSSSPP
jgi:hypothetical protein